MRLHSSPRRLVLALAAWPIVAVAAAQEKAPPPRTPWPAAYAELQRDFDAIEEAKAGFGRWAAAHPCDMLRDAGFFHDAGARVQLNIGRYGSVAYRRSPVTPFLSDADLRPHRRDMTQWRNLHGRIDAALKEFAAPCDAVARLDAERIRRGDAQASAAFDAALKAARPAADRINAMLAFQPFALAPLDVDPRFEIAEFAVDYAPWEGRHVALKRELDDADALWQSRQNAAAERRRAFETADTEAHAAARALDAAERRLVALRHVAAADGPPDELKTAEYLEIEGLIRRDELRIAQILGRVEALRRDSGNRDPGPIDRLLAELGELEAEQERRRRRLAEIEERVGFAARRAAAAAELRRLETDGTPEFEARRALERREAASISERDRTLGLALAAAAAAQDAENAYGAALARWRKFGQGNRPLVRAVRVHDAATYFRADIWNPAPALARLDAEIDILVAVRRQLDEERWGARADFLNLSAAASGALTNLRGAVLRSAAAQSAIEIGFMLWDVHEKYRESGMLGVMSEIVKKHVEAIYLGPPSFVAYDLDEDTFDRARKLLWDSAPGAKRLAKTFVSGPAAKIIAAQYLERLSLETLESSQARAIWEFERRIAPTAAHAIRLQLQVQFVADARKKLKDAVAKALFAEPGKTVMQRVKDRLWGGSSNFVRSAAKDALKAVLKNLAAEFFEGEAMRNYVEAELASQTAARIFSAAGYSYWHAVDVLDLKLALRREILAQYDPKNHTRTLEKRAFGERVDLTIEIETEDDPANTIRREMEVLLGQVRARRLDRGERANALRFAISREDLARARHTGDGALALRVIVTQ